MTGWHPQWCHHVAGVPRPRGTDDDPEDPIAVDMQCTVCQGRWRSFCYSGHWDFKVIRFAMAHYHCWYAPVP